MTGCRWAAITKDEIDLQHPPHWCRRSFKLGFRLIADGRDSGAQGQLGRKPAVQSLRRQRPVPIARVVYELRLSTRARGCRRAHVIPEGLSLRSGAIGIWTGNGASARRPRQEVHRQPPRMGGGFRQAQLTLQQQAHVSRGVGVATYIRIAATSSSSCCQAASHQSSI